MQTLLRFLKEEDGPAAVEYAVMLALIIAVCIGALKIFGTTAGGSFIDSAAKINTATSS